MHSLETGVYAKKYSFWALEYVFRREDFYLFFKRFYDLQHHIIGKYAPGVDAGPTFLNCIYEYIQDNGISVASKDLNSIRSMLTEDNKFYCKYGYSASCCSFVAEDIIKSALTSDGCIHDNFRGSTSGIMFKIDIKNKKNHPVRYDVSTNGMVLDIGIDLTKPTIVLVKEIESVINSAKMYANGVSDDFLGEEFSASFYETLADSEASFRSGYNPKSDISRAIGLWLWDSIKKNGGKYDSVIRAIEEFESMPNFEDYGLGSAPDYYHWLRRTEACIEAAEVLTFDKKNPETKKGKRPSGTRKRKLVPGTQTAK